MYRKGKTMYIFANVNPINKYTDDCVVRAAAIVMDIPWERAYMELCQMGLMLYDMPNQKALMAEECRIIPTAVCTAEEMVMEMVATMRDIIITMIPTAEMTTTRTDITRRLLTA